MIDYIIEIGAEKLKRDYSSHLIGEELCTGRHLETFFETVSGNGTAVEMLAVHSPRIDKKFDPQIADFL